MYKVVYHLKPITLVLGGELHEVIQTTADLAPINNDDSLLEIKAVTEEEAEELLESLAATGAAAEEFEQRSLHDITHDLRGTLSSLWLFMEHTYGPVNEGKAAAAWLVALATSLGEHLAVVHSVAEAVGIEHITIDNVTQVVRDSYTEGAGILLTELGIGPGDPDEDDYEGEWPSSTPDDGAPPATAEEATQFAIVAADLSQHAESCGMDAADVEALAWAIVKGHLN